MLFSRKTSCIPLFTLYPLSFPPPPVAFSIMSDQKSLIKEAWLFNLWHSESVSASTPCSMLSPLHTGDIHRELCLQQGDVEYNTWRKFFISIPIHLKGNRFAVMWSPGRKQFQICHLCSWAGTQCFRKGFWIAINGERCFGCHNAEVTVSIRRICTSLWKSDPNYCKELRLQSKR